MDDNAYAIMEGEMIVAVDEYIAARPQLDSTHNRRIYEAGFRTAWNRRAEAVPEGWIRAADEELVSAHLNVANQSDTYEEAKKKLSRLIDWHVSVAADPKVNGGYKLVPIEPTKEMQQAALRADDDAFGVGIYKAMLAAAPEVKK